MLARLLWPADVFGKALYHDRCQVVKPTHVPRGRRVRPLVGRVMNRYFVVTKGNLSTTTIVRFVVVQRRLVSMCVFLILALLAFVCHGQNVTFTTPLTPAVNDTLTFQRIARANVLGALQVMGGLCRVLRPVLRFGDQSHLMISGRSQPGPLRCSPASLPSGC